MKFKERISYVIDELIPEVAAGLALNQSIKP